MSERAAAVRAFLREFVTGIDGPPATAARIRAGGWARILLVAPLIVAPTGAMHLGYGLSRGPAARAVVAGWWALAVLWIAASAAIVALPIARARAARALTYACLLFELGTNQFSTYAIGALSSHGPLYILIVVAIYRVFFDWALGRFALIAGIALFAGNAALELGGVVPLHPYLPPPVRLPAYGDLTAATTVVFWVASGVALSFCAINYGVNQAVKLHRYITESVLRRYLPPSLVERAARGELRLDAEPERRVVTVLFSDLVGFTALSEKLGPDEVGRLLNRYLSSMADVAHAHGATVDKFVGDAVMIVFGAPDPLEPREQARRCVALARELQGLLPSLDSGARLRARIGINTGEAVVGNFGSLARSDFTVIGPSVNVAARLETASRPGAILLGEETARLLGGEVPLEPAGELRLKGVSAPVRAYFVSGGPASIDPPDDHGYHHGPGAAEEPAR